MTFQWILLLVGLVLLGVFAVSFSRGLASRNWPSTTGTVVSSGVERRESDDGTDFKPKIVYEYSVMGEKYYGERRSFSSSTTAASRAYRIADRYPPGTRVDVYYHPEKPQLAVLEPGISSGTVVAGIFGLGLVGYAVYKFLGF